MNNIDKLIKNYKNKEGKIEDTFASFTGPMSKKIINKLDKIL